MQAGEPFGGKTCVGDTLVPLRRCQPCRTPRRGSPPSSGSPTSRSASSGRGGARGRRRPQGVLQRRPVQRPPRADHHLGPARPARGPPRAAPTDPRGDRPGRLRGGADRLRPGPPPPGRGPPGPGHRPLEEPGPGRPGGQERPPGLPPPGRASAKGLLHPVRVPTEQEEADRQVLRLRELLVRKTRSVQSQIKSFLLQHGLAEPAGLAVWSKRGGRRAPRAGTAAGAAVLPDCSWTSCPRPGAGPAGDRAAEGPGRGRPAP